MGMTLVVESLPAGDQRGSASDGKGTRKRCCAPGTWASVDLLLTAVYSDRLDHILQIQHNSISQ